MTIIYIHGVKVRSPEHGRALEKPFRRWVGPKLTVGGVEAAYDPVYWGDVAASFRWNLSSRPKTRLLAQGTGDAGALFQGLGSLREAGSETPLDRALLSSPRRRDPVLRFETEAVEKISVPPISRIAREKRADFLADLYLALYPKTATSATGHDLIVDDPIVAGLADAATAVALEWDDIASGQDDALRATELMKRVDTALHGDGLIAQGAKSDWLTGVRETLQRATAWPGDAVSTVFAELRPTLNAFLASFIGDVFTYLNNRGDAVPGEVPRRVLDALIRAHRLKQQSGERIIVVTHSMGGQLLYDALTHFASTEPELSELEVDHWVSCGSQVSFFAELGLFKGQPQNTCAPARLPKPANVKVWTNYFDYNDPVGFVMEPVFADVCDREYNTGYGLAFAHTGYLARPSFFEAVAERL